jgi:hypothetical protein
MSEKPAPKCLAMLICDYVIRDAVTQNKSLIGIFNTINAVSYPVRHDRMNVFVALTDGHGSYASSLRVRGAGGDRLVGIDGRIDMKDPLAVVEIVFELRGLIIPSPGRYFVEFLCDGELLMDRTFDAVTLPAAPPGGS